jgi:hypothetical protein
MLILDHAEAADLAQAAMGPFGYLTVHTGVLRTQHAGEILHWVWSLREKTGFNAESWGDYIAKEAISNAR